MSKRVREDTPASADHPTLTRAAKRRKKTEFKVGKHVFTIMEAHADMLVPSPNIADTELNKILLSPEFANLLCADLGPTKTRKVRQKVFAGTEAQTITRLRTYMRDLVSTKHIVCHGFDGSSEGCQAIFKWMMARVSNAEMLRCMRAVAYVRDPRVSTLVDARPRTVPPPHMMIPAHSHHLTSSRHTPSPPHLVYENHTWSSHLITLSTGESYKHEYYKRRGTTLCRGYLL